MLSRRRHRRGQTPVDRCGLDRFFALLAAGLGSPVSAMRSTASILRVVLAGRWSPLESHSLAPNRLPLSAVPSPFAVRRKLPSASDIGSALEERFQASPMSSNNCRDGRCVLVFGLAQPNIECGLYGGQHLVNLAGDTLRQVGGLCCCCDPPCLPGQGYFPNDPSHRLAFLPLGAAYRPARAEVCGQETPDTARSE